MFKNQLVMHTMNDGKEFSFFLSPSSTFIIRKGFGFFMERYEGHLSKDAYKMFMRAWEMAGMVPVKTTITPSGNLNAPFWYSITYDLTVQLVAYYERELDYGPGEEAHDKVWQLNLSKPLGKCGASESDTVWSGDFQEFLVQGLHNHGFRFSSPESAYSPTGQMYNRLRIQGHDKSMRLLVYNTWARDV